MFQFGTGHESFAVINKCTLQTFLIYAHFKGRLNQSSRSSSMKLFTQKLFALLLLIEYSSWKSSFNVSIEAHKVWKLLELINPPYELHKIHAMWSLLVDFYESYYIFHQFA